MFSFIKLQITEEISSTDTSARVERPVANEDNEELEAAPKKLIVSLLEEDDEEGDNNAEKVLNPRLNKSPTILSRYHTVVEGLKKLVF